MHQSEFYNTISDEIFESYCGRSVTEVLWEEKGDEDRLVLARTDQKCFILHLWWCVRGQEVYIFMVGIWIGGQKRL